MNENFFNIIQWNLNGVFSKIDELKIIIHKYNPQLICLQETNFKNNYTAPLQNYKGFSTNRKIANRASGGVTIYVKSNIIAKELKINTSLECSAVLIKHDETFTICNIYLPNQTTIELLDVQNIINQLPKPYIILGDFNAHNIIWGSNTTDQRGKTIETILLNENLILLNDLSPTHINLANGNFSNIDLSLCTPQSRK